MKTAGHASHAPPSWTTSKFGLNLAQAYRHENLRILTLHQQRDVLAGFGYQLAQLLSAFHRRSVHRQNDIAGLDAGLRCRAAHITYHDTSIHLGLLLLFRG